MATAYLSLGSNIGDRAGNIARAVAELPARDVRVVKKSSLYETEPVEVREQEWFLNCVVEAETSLTAQELMHALLGIERSMGRERLVPKGPRIIDMDILMFGSSVVREAEPGDSASANGGAAVRAGAVCGDCAGGGASGDEEERGGAVERDGGSK